MSASFFSITAISLSPSLNMPLLSQVFDKLECHTKSRLKASIKRVCHCERFLRSNLMGTWGDCFVAKTTPRNDIPFLTHFMHDLV